MADFTYGGGADFGDSGPDLKRIVSLTGAFLSVALVAGLVWWGWTLMLRDVHGVPVVRALEGAMRVTPADPGGREAAHQGLAVSAIQAEGVVSPPPEAIVLAPRAPDLTVDDLPQPVLLASEALAAEAAAEALAVSAAEAPDDAVILAAVDPGLRRAVPPPVAVPESAIAPSAIEAALAEALGLSLDGAQPVLADVAATPSGIVPASAPGVARSPRPAPRPEGDGIDTGPPIPIVMPIVAPASTGTVTQRWLSEPAPGVPSLSRVSIAVAPPGQGRVVQLGAFDTSDQAEAEWVRLTSAHVDLLGDRRRTVEEAVTNGRTFFRLRAGGFADLADARRFCSALVANGAPCIPVPQ